MSGPKHDSTIELSEAGAADIPMVTPVLEFDDDDDAAVILTPRTAAHFVDLIHDSQLNFVDLSEISVGTPRNWTRRIL